MFKRFDIFDNFPKPNYEWNLFNLKLTLRFPRGLLENLKGFLSPGKMLK